MVGSEVSVSVDALRRRSIQRHHSATHILHWAMRQVLGTHIRQAGSYVDAERLRFDFTHYEAPSAEQLKEIENLANYKILANDPVSWRVIPRNEVPPECMALFSEKYGAVVRMVEMGNFSKELCGGTHVSATGEIGFIKILGEGAISAGTRRIEAVAGVAALQKVEQMQSMLGEISRELSCKTEETPTRLRKLVATKNELEKELKGFRKENAGKLAKSLANDAVLKDGKIPFMVRVVEIDSPAMMRELAVDAIKERPDGVAVLGASFGEKATVLVLCSADAVSAGIKAGDIVREIAGKLGGKGGGKPDFAQGGGSSKDIEKVFSEYKDSIK